MLHTFYNCKILHKCITSDQSILNFLHAGFVEVGRVWLELPSPIHSYKPNTSSIRKPSSTRIIILSTADLYIYIYIRFVILGKLCELEIIPNNLAAA